MRSMCDSNGIKNIGKVCVMKEKLAVAKLLGVISCVISLSACAAVPTVSPTFSPTASEVDVMILGTFHFTGGGSDVVNPNVQNYLAAEGQEQIGDLLDRLENYAPDKIMLELEPKYEADFNKEYRAYLNGKHELGVNERQQVGMRLAARLGHERLYAIDFDNFLDYRGALAAAKQLGQQDLLEEYEGWGEQVRAKVDSTENLPLLDHLGLLNSDEFGDDRKTYLTIAQMGSVDDPQGALQILTWWERNMVMFARTAQHAEPGDKILIIVGAGHLRILQEFFEDAHGFNLIHPLPYLER